MPPSSPPAALEAAAAKRMTLILSVCVGLLAAIAACFCVVPYTTLRACAISVCVACYSLYSDDADRNPGSSSAFSADKADSDAPKAHVWKLETIEEREAAKAHAAIGEADVARLQTELAAAVADAEERVEAAAQADARRTALLAEASHVSDEAAGVIEEVVRESRVWADDARRHAPQQADQVQFMAQTMVACGHAALAPGATAAQRCQATEMAKLCSEAMVSDAQSRARRAEHRASELERQVRAARADDVYMRGELSRHGSMAQQVRQAERAALNQQAVLEGAAKAVRTVCSHGSLHAQVGSPPTEIALPDDDEDADGSDDEAPHGATGWGAAAQCDVDGGGRGRRRDRNHPRSHSRFALAPPGPRVQQQSGHGSKQGGIHCSTSAAHTYSPLAHAATTSNWSSGHEERASLSSARHDRCGVTPGVKLREADLPYTYTFTADDMAAANEPPLTATSRSTEGRRHAPSSKPPRSPSAPSRHRVHHPAKSKPPRRLGPSSPHQRHGTPHQTHQPHQTLSPSRPRRTAHSAHPPTRPPITMPSPHPPTSPSLHAELESIFEAALSVAVYEYNDILIRVRDTSGALLPSIGGEASWARLLAATTTRPLFLALDAPDAATLDPAALCGPDRRLWLYGAAGASFAAFHLGGERPHARLGDRIEISTHEVYGGGPLTDAGHGFVIAPARPGEERTRHVRILAPRTRRARHAALDEEDGAHSLYV